MESAYSLSSLNLDPLMTHFVIVYNGQASSPATSGYYATSVGDWERLVQMYAYVARMLGQGGRKFVHVSGEYEGVVAMRSTTGSGLSIFAAFNPLTKKDDLHTAITGLDRWASARKLRLFNDSY